MKLNMLAEAIMWLPGFGPNEDPLASSTAAAEPVRPVLTVIEGGKKTSIHRTVKPAMPPKAVWPMLEAGVFSELSGPASKFDANVAAIELLRVLEGDQREPTDAERTTLNQFTGWGGLAAAFNGYHSEIAWRHRATKLKALLSDDEYEAARASTPNSHFTPHEVVAAMWEAVARMGFTGGKVLEPASGCGYFLGAMPTKLAQKSTMTAVELEPTSSRITKALYGQFGVRTINQGFEAAKLPEGFFDLVISNVPFGAYKVPETRAVPFRGFNIHDYFIARALEVTRPGGIVACITTSGTMDKESDAVRRYLASQAELVGAIRLPSSTFKAIAGTEVTTDILFFKKNAAGAAATNPEPMWAERPVNIPSHDPRREGNQFAAMRINPYFADDSSWVVGKFGMVNNGYGLAPAAIFDGDLAEALSERVSRLPMGVFSPRETGEVEVSPREYIVATAEWVKPGAYVLVDGKVAVSLGDELKVIEDSLQASKAKRIKGLIPVRDAVRKLVAVQAATENDDTVAIYRTALSASYDAFVKEQGFISAKMNQRAFREDPDFPLMLSLERWDDETQIAEKADIFSRRTVGSVRKIERCEAPEEALLVCLAERGKVVPERIAELLEAQTDDAMDALREMGLVFMEPVDQVWVERDRYLSGNVRIKLIQAESAGEGFAGNAKALEAVIPADLAPTEISAKLGSNWIPPEDISEFCSEVILGGSTQRVKVRYNADAAIWTVSNNASGVGATQTYGTNRANAWSLLELALNQQTPKVTDRDPDDPDGKKRVVNATETVAAREKQEAIKEAFVEWLWKDDARAERLCRFYNDTFNSIVTRKYDGSHLTLPGFSMAYNLHKHQKDVIWRGISGEGNTLMAHAVGAGKTLSMICIGMEMRRVGLASKPCFAVPNHMLEQFAAEFLRAYPAANVLVASKEDMIPERRQALLSRIATGDWDGVVITHASFEKVELPEEFVTQHIEGMIRQQEIAMRLESDEGNTRAVKQIERQKKMWEARLKKSAAGTGKDDLLTFDEVGFDAIFCDEAHLFKNLYRYTRLQMPGLPTNDSMRAFDMYLKTRYVMNKRGEEKGVVFATGTPIANSVAEMWVMQHYLQPRLLAERGVDMFDAWASNFGEAVTALELAPDGSSYRLHTRFARFVNVPELMSMFREVADIRTKEMLDLPIPEAIRETVVANGGPILKAYVAELVERAEAVKKGMDPRIDNMLKITTDGRKAATDLRLMGMEIDSPGSKVNLCVENVLKVWHAHKATKGTQLVFLDMGTPNSGWSLYKDIRDKLCEQGIPQNEVAFIHEAGTDQAKERLFKAVRDGRVRVLIGSTAKMGMGTNVQERLVALHHVDGPWRPADVEQRDGRIERQGNLNRVVYLFRYVTEGSFDAYVWQTLETKARFIAQVMSGDTSVRTLEDAELSALSYAEVKALASGNPMVIEKAGVDGEVMRLSMLKTKWQQQQWSNRREVADLPERVARGRQLQARVEADLNRVIDTRGDRFRAELGGQVYTDREEAGKRVLGAFASIRQGEVRTLGTIGGLTLELEGPRNLLGKPWLYLTGESQYEVTDVVRSAMGVTRMIEHALMNWPTEELERITGRVSYDAVRLEQLQAVINVPFEHAEKLEQLVARKAVIDRELCVNESEKSVVVDVSEVAEAA